MSQILFLFHKIKSQEIIISVSRIQKIFLFKGNFIGKQLLFTSKKNAKFDMLHTQKWHYIIQQISSVFLHLILLLPDSPTNYLIGMHQWFHQSLVLHYNSPVKRFENVSLTGQQSNLSQQPFKQYKLQDYQDKKQQH